MKEAFFGIVIRAYNVEDYIEKAVNSVINQLYQDWMAVIVDDGSTDNTGILSDEISKKDLRINVIHTKGEGCVIATLKGIESMKCKYIAVLDGDDWYDRNYLMAAALCIEKYNADIVLNGMRTISEDEHNTTEIRLAEKETIMDKNNIINYVLERSAYGISIKIIRKELYHFSQKELEFFYKEKKNLNFNEDTYQIIPILCNCEKAVILNSCLYQYLLRQKSISRKLDPWPQIRYIFMTMNYIMEVLKERKELDKTKEILVMRECVRELSPRVNYIVKRIYKEKKNRISVNDIPYYYFFRKSNYFSWTLKKHGLKAAVGLWMFMTLNTLY